MVTTVYDRKLIKYHNIFCVMSCFSTQSLTNSIEICRNLAVVCKCNFHLTLRVVLVISMKPDCYWPHRCSSTSNEVKKPGTSTLPHASFFKRICDSLSLFQRTVKREWYIFNPINSLHIALMLSRRHHILHILSCLTLGLKDNSNFYRIVVYIGTQCIYVYILVL